MTWKRIKTAAKGARRGNPVVMSLTGHAYFDTPESRLPGEPPCANWIPPISLKKAYSWDPLLKELEGTPAATNILGASACIWSDRFLHNANVLADKPGEGTTRSEAYVDYLSLPRMAALAEVSWTKKELRDYDDFTRRMKKMYIRYFYRGYQFRMPTPLLEMPKRPKTDFVVTATSPIEGGVVRYTLDGTDPTETSPVLNKPLKVKVDQVFKTATFAFNKRSLIFTYQNASKALEAKYGEKIGTWNPKNIGKTKAKKLMLDATGKINKNGKYRITFVYTKGRDSLIIDEITVLQNDQKVVAQDKHIGKTGRRSRKNGYTVTIKNYETGASYKIKALVHGERKAHSFGSVFIKRIK